MVFRGELDVEIQGYNTNCLRIFFQLGFNIWTVYPESKTLERQWNSSHQLHLAKLKLISPSSVFPEKADRKTQPLTSWIPQKNPQFPPRYLLGISDFHFPLVATGHLLRSQLPAFPGNQGSIVGASRLHPPRPKVRHLEPPPKGRKSFFTNGTPRATGYEWIDSHEVQEALNNTKRCRHMHMHIIYIVMLCYIVMI